MKNLFEGYEIALVRYIYVKGDESDKENLEGKLINRDYSKLPSNENTSFLQLNNNILTLNLASQEIPDEDFDNHLRNMNEKYGKYSEGKKYIDILAQQRQSGSAYTSERALN